MEKEGMQLEEITSVHVMLDFLWGLDVKKRLHVLTFWWFWCSNRNKLQEGELPLEAEEVARRTRSSVIEYLQVFTPTQVKQPPDKWRPPEVSTYKINVDGSFIPGQVHVGWGVAVRSADGKLICARAGKANHIGDAFAAEAIAMSQAISMASDLGLVRVQLETDSQLLAEALDLCKVDSSAYAALIEDMKYQLKLWFSSASIYVCMCSANSVAHVFANIGRECECDHHLEWWYDVPAQVGACILGDMPRSC